MRILSRSGRITELDGIRGMALLFVIASHISIPSNFIFAGSGKEGVWLFFILSSFLLSSYFLSFTERTKSILEWGNYIVRRILRIYPLYTFVLLIYFLFYKSGGITKDNFIKHLLLQDGIEHFWTMPVEIHFYFVLPFILLLIVFVLKRSILFSAILLIASFVLQQIFDPPSLSKVNDYHLLTYFSVFLIGCFLAVIYERTKEINFSPLYKVSFDLVSILILIAMIVTMPNVWSILFYKVPNDYFHRDFIWYGITWAVFVWLTIHGTLFKKIFSLPFIRIIGVISYSAYLIHPMIIDIVAKHMKMGIISTILILVIVFICSFALHLFIEKPCMKVNLLTLQRNKLKQKLQAEI
jgi:peptidoglycan/LPS O-acetylase OafA/YrhL